MSMATAATSSHAPQHMSREKSGHHSASSSSVEATDGKGSKGTESKESISKESTSVPRRIPLHGNRVLAHWVTAVVTVFFAACCAARAAAVLLRFEMYTSQSGCVRRYSSRF